jgi:hypothetical protein
MTASATPENYTTLTDVTRTGHPNGERSLCDANAKELRERLLAGDLEVAI